MHKMENQVLQINRFYRSLLGAFAILSYLLSTQVTMAQGRKIAIVRDAEIESLLKDYSSPIFRVAGLQSKGIDIVLVNDNNFNAFVSGRRVFINTGAILQSATPNEIIGVIAHEAGHLAGNHQERLRAQLDASKTLAIVGMLLGAGALVAGSTSNSNGASSAGGAIIAAAPSLATRGLLNYKRGEEINADSAALKYLNKTKQSANGMLKTFDRFAQQLALAGVRPNPYKLSHPLPRERISLLAEGAKKSRYFNQKDPKSLQTRHNMARAKIAAFAGGLAGVQRLFRSSPNSLPALYGRAIALDNSGRSNDALKIINQLIKKQSKNAYLYELRGEVQLKLRKADQAVKSFATAAKLDRSKSGLIKARLGFAYVATGNRSNAKKAVSALRAGLQTNPNNFNAYRTLSNAYALAGDIGDAELAMAEGHFRAGNTRDAKIFAGRAVQKLVPGKPSWQRAKDILTVGN
jgi:predicted Zn-dependent protease